MSRPRKRDIKPDFLQFLDLFYDCRNEEVGKKGRTRIKLTELQRIFLGSEKLNEFVSILVTDGVIKEPSTPISYHMNESGNFITEADTDEIELWSFLTKEEILEYRYSLTGTRSAHAVFRAPTWESVMIKLVDAKNMLVTITGTDVLDVPATYGTLGFANSRSGKPLDAWEFLLVLFKHNGTIARTHPDAQSFGNNIDKLKQGVKEKLQTVFNIPDEDPFKPINKHNRVYELKCTIGTENSLRVISEDNQESSSPYEEELERYN